MSDLPPRSSRVVHIADHLWDTLQLMSAEIGVDRDGLVNQALFSFARQNGYLQPGAVRPVAIDASEPARSPVVAAPALPTAPQRPAALSIPPTPAFAASVRTTHEEDTPSTDRPIEPPAFMANDVAALPSLASPPYVPPVSTPEDDASDPGFDPPSDPSTPASRYGREEVPTPDELRLPRSRALSDDEPSEHYSGAPALPEALPSAPPPLPARDPADQVLVLIADGHEAERVTGDRFLIGRGKHCDLVIDSGKVSREHAAIVRDDGMFFIEDLGSSNGTWFDKRRITRRRIEDGDEYFICAERLTCRLE